MSYPEYKELKENLLGIKYVKKVHSDRTKNYERIARVSIDSGFNLCTESKDSFSFLDDFFEGTDAVKINSTEVMFANASLLLYDYMPIYIEGKYRITIIKFLIKEFI